MRRLSDRESEARWRWLTFCGAISQPSPNSLLDLCSTGSDYLAQLCRMFNVSSSLGHQIGKFVTQEIFFNLRGFPSVGDFLHGLGASQSQWRCVDLKLIQLILQRQVFDPRLKRSTARGDRSGAGFNCGDLGIQLAMKRVVGLCEGLLQTMNNFCVQRPATFLRDGLNANFQSFRKPNFHLGIIACHC